MSQNKVGRYHIRFESHRGVIYTMMMDMDTRRKRPRYAVWKSGQMLPVFQGKYGEALQHFGYLLKTEVLADLMAIPMVRAAWSATRCAPSVSFADRLRDVQEKPLALAKLLPRAFKAAFKTPHMKVIKPRPEAFTAPLPPRSNEFPFA